MADNIRDEDVPEETSEIVYDPPPEKPVWADEMGTDEFGTFASKTLGSVEFVMRWIPPKVVDGCEEIAGHWMGETPVTQELYEAVMGTNPAHFRGPKRPVESVSYSDCREFIEALNALIPGADFDLPSEHMWEWAARAGVEGPEGEVYGPLNEIAWHHDNSGGETHPVKEKLPNSWGLYDMLGNVWEWSRTPN